MHVAVKAYSDVALPVLNHRRDSLLAHLVEKSVSPQLINSAVYDCLKQKKYENAVAWAQVLNLYQPGQANYMDTLGEAYYQARSIEMAKYYSGLLKKLDPKAPGEAIANWERNAKR